MTVLGFDEVSKKFGDVHAVDHLSFTVEPGGIYGFLGGNGAGKSTSMRMVLDILRPTSGTITVLGGAPGRGNAAYIGFLPEERGLYGKMSAIDTVIYFARLKGMAANDARIHGMELLERFMLADRAKSPVGDMSKGMAQKVQLATALVNRPQLLLLDEPFSGLDPLNQALLEQEIARAAAGGAAVIFSTHVMQHAERLCDRLLLLRRGQKRFEGTLAEARALLPARIEAVARDDITSLPMLANSQRTGTAGDGWSAWRLTLQDNISSGTALEHCTRSGIALRQFEERRPSLHEVFVELVGEGDVRP